MKISDIYEDLTVREILTSRGTITIEVDLHTVIGVFRSSCPEGASVGKEEAIVLKDGGTRFAGHGMQKALFNINSLIIPRLKTCDILTWDQQGFDSLLCELDGTSNKKRLGANAILPVSMALCRAGAVSKNRSLREHIGKLLMKGPSDVYCKIPQPFFNVLNGGEHAFIPLKIQEIMVSFKGDILEVIEKVVRFYAMLKKMIKEKYCNANVGDEGGFAVPVETVEEALDLIMETYKEMSKEDNIHDDLEIALDCAANSFYKDGEYQISNKSILSGEELIKFYISLSEKYPLVSIEDPFAEDDFESWENFMKVSKIRVVGDDLTVTNKDKLRKEQINTVLIKLNQIGTVSEAIDCVKKARELGMKIMVSHRSGETEDTFISDFAVGVGAEYFKAGAPCRGERTCKYNQLIRISEAINSNKN